MRKSQKGVYVQKGVGGFDEFLKHYQKFKNSECAIHFRYATCGKTDKNNAHPYLVNDDVWMMHNGVFPTLGDGERSDSWEFAEMIAPYAKELHNPQFQELIKMASEHQKLVFCDKNGLTVIDPDDWFEDENGILYSNSYGFNVSLVPSLLTRYKKYFSQMKAYQKSDVEKKMEQDNENLIEGSEDYIRFWEGADVSANTYDSEENLSSRDEQPYMNIMAGIVEDPTSLSRQEWRVITTEEPVLTAEIMFDIIRKI